MERKGTPILKDSKESFPNPMLKVPLAKRPLKVNMQEVSETSSLTDVDLLKKIIDEHNTTEENVNNENISECETSLFSCKASLYQFLDEVWRLIERIVGVFILSNQTNTRYRIVGFNSEKKCVLNTPIFATLFVQFGSDTFVKWRDGKYIYGLSFQNEPTSKTFSKAVLDSAYKLSQITTYKRRKSLIESSKIDYSSTDSVNILLEPENNLNSREKVVKEIFTSEKDYLHKLTQLIEECYNPTVNGKYKNVFTKEERKAIYGNVEIMKGINTNLLRDLEKKLGKWSPVQTIGDSFVQMIPFFKVYKEYYTGYEAGIELLEKLSKKKDVAAYLKHCETVADGHKLPYLLIMPVQRIPRYSLLLNELIKQTDPSHPDYSDLIAAKDDLKEFTMNVNESVRGQEHYRKFSEQVQDPKKYIGFDAILAPHRNLIFESEVEVNMGDRVYTWTLLFTDLLVFASTSGKKKTVEEKLSIEQIWFEDLADLGCETKFRIVTPSTMYLVDVKSVLEKQKWLSIADKTISSWLTNRITFDGQTRKFGYIFPNNGRYDGEWLYAKPHGQGTFIYPNGNLYVGSFESGKRSGSGKLIYNNNGGVYEGYWASNRPDGYGRLALRTGTYEGNFQNGYKSGAGKMTWANGDVYDGHWADDCMHSNGTLITSSFTYVGDWEKNMFHGKGVLTFPGGKYEGQWVHDRKEGEGVFVDSVGDIYTGSWKDDAYHGQGVFTKSTGNYKYEGEWEANKRNGNGTLTVLDHTYKGAWKDDRCNGFGVITCRDGTTYEGYWIDGRKEGVGLWKTADNEVYEGQWVNDKKHGRGKFVFRDGSNYEGEWVNDRKEGKGVFTWPNGMKYSGTWLADKRHGKGVLSSHDESFKYAGEWVNGYRHGKGILTDQLGTYEGEWVDDKRHGAGKFVSVDGITLEGTWNNNLIDGDANYTKKDVTLQVFFKESHLEKPDYEILAPLLPPLKTLKL